jgi:hypothetical protein
VTRARAAAAIAAVVVAGSCSVEKLPPIRMVHRGTGAPRRAVVLPTECAPSETAPRAEDPRAWCKGIEAIVAGELAFRGVELVDLAKLPAGERTRHVVAVSSQIHGASSERREVTVTGPTYSDVDMWTQRAALDALGVDTLVRVRAARLPTWPIRTLALVRMVRPSDASLIAASVCELEVSRVDGEAETIERATRCALQGIAP